MATYHPTEIKLFYLNYYDRRAIQTTFTKRAKTTSYSLSRVQFQSISLGRTTLTLVSLGMECSFCLKWCFFVGA